MISVIDGAVVHDIEGKNPGTLIQPPGFSRHKGSSQISF